MSFDKQNKFIMEYNFKISCLSNYIYIYILMQNKIATMLILIWVQYV